MLGRILHWGLTGEWLKLPKICEYNDKRWSKTLSFGNFVVFDIISYPLGGVMEYHTNMGIYTRNLHELYGMSDNFPIHGGKDIKNQEQQEEIYNAIRDYQKYRNKLHESER